VPARGRVSSFARFLRIEAANFQLQGLALASQLVSVYVRGWTLEVQGLEG
jgi:hypothetical protein